MSEINWIIEKRKIKDLKPYSKNPRRINKNEFTKLVQSIMQDGYHDRIKVVGTTIVSGHQRLKALLECGWAKSSEIEVLVPDRELSDVEFERVCIRSNLINGEWDFDGLANYFDAHDLVIYGMPESLLGVLDCEEDQEELEQKPKKKVKLCQECGAEQ